MKNKLHFFHFTSVSQIYKNGPESVSTSTEMGLDLGAQVTEWLSNSDLGMEDIAKSLDGLNLKELQQLTQVLDERIAETNQEGNLNQTQDIQQLRSFKLATAQLAVEEYASDSTSSAKSLREILAGFSSVELQQIYAAAEDSRSKAWHEGNTVHSDKERLAPREKAKNLENLLEGDLALLIFEQKIKENPGQANDLLVANLKLNDAEITNQSQWRLLPDYVVLMDRAGLELDMKKLEPVVKVGIDAMLNSNWEGGVEAAIYRFRAAENVGLITAAVFLKSVEHDFKKRIDEVLPRLSQSQNWESRGNNEVASIVLSKDITRMNDFGLSIDKKALRVQLEKGILSYVENSQLSPNAIRGKVEAFAAPYKEFLFTDLDLSRAYEAIKRKATSQTQ